MMIVKNGDEGLWWMEVVMTMMKMARATKIVKIQLFSNAKFVFVNF